MRAYIISEHLHTFLKLTYTPMGVLSILIITLFYKKVKLKGFGKLYIMKDGYRLVTIYKKR